MSSDISVEDLKSMCRACMTTSGEFVSLETEVLARTDFVLSTSVAVSENDKLMPMRICKPCLEKCTEHLLFRKTCQNNDAFMRLIVRQAEAEADQIETNMEVETAEDDEEGKEEPEKDEFDNPILKCPVCWKKCIGYKDFEAHVGTHVSAGNYVCPICGIRYSRSDSFKDHMYIHTNLKFNCDHCGKKLTRPKALADHLARVHFLFRRNKDEEAFKKDLEERQLALDALVKISSEQGATASNDSSEDEGDDSDPSRKKYRCPICSEKLDSDRAFDAHICIHITKQIRTCPLCAQTFLRRENLRYHMWTHTGQKFKCEICERVLAHPKALRDHHRNYHQAPPGAPSTSVDDIVPIPHDGVCHPCQICGKMFHSMPALYKHSKSHSKDKPHPCKQCPAVFRLAANLKIHMDKHKKNTFSCKLCPESFYTKAAYDEHTLSHETGALCTTCGLVLPTNTRLNQHMISEHASGRGIICKECGARFETTTRYDRHMKEEHTREGFECSVCGKSYPTQRSCVMHKRRFHGVLSTIGQKRVETKLKNKLQKE